MYHYCRLIAKNYYSQIFSLQILLLGRDAPILPANFFEKQEAKSKEQNSGKIGENLENSCLKTVT